MTNEGNLQMTEEQETLRIIAILCSSQFVFEYILGTGCRSSKVNKMCFGPWMLSA